ncbi:PucR family transcriptional regulator ligand-binding domain-containing protein [Pseudonocardia sp. ICBG601]|uniref:PucR family transcriptional regulator ligand-binding domain-containing protein n=1 Tax=Pseudonocardia sp. ICBG601 TaxID=2846759 RepID=UPI0027E25667|nr:PucR family transcriptional regulator ligand-binding domain-containing protein [Pseudonocardia sp. ICBG601]
MLVLSVGMPVADPTTVPARYVDALRAAGAVGLVVEIGQQLPSLPAGWCRPPAAAGFPLVELRRTVRFAEIVAACWGRSSTAADDLPGPPGAEAAFPVARPAPGGARARGSTSWPAGSTHPWCARTSRTGSCSRRAARTCGTGWRARASPGPPGPRLGGPRRSGGRARGVGRLTVRRGRRRAPPTGSARCSTPPRTRCRCSTRIRSSLLRAARDALVADLAVAVPSDAGRLAVRARAAGLDTAVGLSVVALRATGDHSPEQGLDAALAVVAPRRRWPPPHPASSSRSSPATAARCSPRCPPRWPRRRPGPAPSPTCRTCCAGPARTRPPPRDRGGRGPVRVPALRRLVVHRLGDDPHLLGFAADVLGPVGALPAAARTDARDTCGPWSTDGGGSSPTSPARLGGGPPGGLRPAAPPVRPADLDSTDPEVRTTLHLALLVDARAAR